MTALPRRKLLALLALSGCAPATPLVVAPGAAPPASDAEALVAIGLRRLTRQGCVDAFDPAFTLEGTGGRRSFSPPRPGDAGWQPDPAGTGTRRDVALLRLPAGEHAVTRMVVIPPPSGMLPTELPPWHFQAAAGRMTYVGGLGLAPAFAGRLGCSAWTGGVFWFSEPEADLALLRARHPGLGEVAVRAAPPEGWQRG
jgi:hypothetical protein